MRRLIHRSLSDLWGPYHSNHGHVFAGENVPESTSVQEAYQSGAYGIVNCTSYSGYPFADEVKLCCETWKVNKVYGIILCPTEGGVVNNTADTSLWVPGSSSYGMIQAMHRFSELSKIYPQIEGVILDDYFGNYPGNINATQMKAIKNALLGKHVDSSGNVDSMSVSTTPNLKFCICIYRTELSRRMLQQRR